MACPSYVLGIDVGSVSVSAAQIDPDKKVIASAYAFHHGDIQKTIENILGNFDLPGQGFIAATSSSSPAIRATEHIDNRVAVITAARHFNPLIGSILIVGGEKFGVIHFDSNGNYRKFKANTSCAAGTGSFLDQQALRLNLSGVEELSRIAMNNTARIPKIASRCAVFAKTDLVHAQQEGYTLAEICDGLCFGLALNVFDTLFINEKPRAPVVFAGGVSRNKAVAKHLGNLIGSDVLTQNAFLYGAVGAALHLLDQAESYRPVRINEIADIFLPEKKDRTYFLAPLEINQSKYPDFSSKEKYMLTPEGFDALNPVEVDIYQNLNSNRRIQAYLGIDIGSTSTKAVLLGSQRQTLAGFYTRTAGRPIDAVQEILATIDALVQNKGLRLHFLGTATTGSGRKFIGKVIGADRIIDEISAHARAAVELNPRVDTIIEIGGQDSKFTTLRNGRVTFSIMNTVCAAGTGSFIEEQAQRLGCPLEDYSRRAENRQAPVSSDRCTVFMERDLNHYLNEGYSVDEVLASVLHSICENYLTKVAIEKNIGNTILFQGATAKNRALVAAFERRLKKPIHVSPYCHLTGALGAALTLCDENVTETQFKGIGLYRKHIPISSEVCSLCTNHCKITLADMGEETVAYGFLCGRDYNIRKYVDNNRSGFDLLKERKKKLAVRTIQPRQENTLTIGIPAALHLTEDLPFWKTFFDQLGIRSITSEQCQYPIKDGKQLAAAEFCAPMTALHGHIAYLLDRSDFIFLPVYLEKKEPDREFKRQYCYYTQYAPSLMPSMHNAGSPERYLMPLIYHLYSGFHTKAQLYHLLKSILPRPVRFLEISAAYDKALKFKQNCQKKLAALYAKRTGDRSQLHVVLLGRPYTVLSKTMNKGIPEILGSMGIPAFYQDMLAYTPQDVEAIRPLLKEIHWYYAAKILEAAEVIARKKNAYPVLMTSFKCSPDSFVVEYFKRIMDAHEKPYLILQLDEHHSSVGYETRIEAAARSFENHFTSEKKKGSRTYPPDLIPLTEKHLTDKTLVLPNWDPISAPLVAANLKAIGIDARLIEESPAGIQRSLKYNTGQCLPLNIIAQNFIDYIEHHHLDPAKTLLWIGHSQISCNIKLYPHHIKCILHAYGNGMEKAGVYTGALSMLDISLKLPLNNYFAYMFGGFIRQIGCRIRPYETRPGDTDQTIARSVVILENAFCNNGSKTDALDRVVSLFEKIPVQKAFELHQRPKVAVFGDLYARDNDVINQDLVRFIEQNGGEVVTTPYTSYIKMIAGPYFKKWFYEGHYLSLLSSKALMATAKHKEKAYYQIFQRIIKEPLHEYDSPAEELLSRYHVRIENTGESMENLLKLFYIKKYYPDIALFVQASPAFCCPALITEAKTMEIEAITGTPIVSITYDGTGGNKNDIIIPYLKYPQKKESPAGRKTRYRLNADR